MEISREEVLMKLGGASKAPAAWRLVDTKSTGRPTQLALNRKKLKKRDDRGRYLLRTNLTENIPRTMQYYSSS